MLKNFNKKKNVIIIPARGNSKGIKNKNLLDFSGKPLLYWTIKQALSCKFVNEVIVSSDSDKILSFSKRNGVTTIKRPKNFSSDTSQSEEAILHVLEETKNFYKTIIFLQATSPLRKRNDIDNAIKTFYKKKYDSLFSCHTAEDHFDIWISKNKKIIPKTINYKKRLPRQLMKTKFYQQNGSIFIFKKEIIERYNNRLGGNIGVYSMDEWQSFQIDTIKQIKPMELLFQKYLKKFCK